MSVGFRALCSRCLCLVPRSLSGLICLPSDCNTSSLTSKLFEPGHSVFGSSSSYNKCQAEKATTVISVRYIFYQGLDEYTYQKLPNNKSSWIGAGYRCKIELDMHLFSPELLTWPVHQTGLLASGFTSWLYSPLSICSSISLAQP